MYIFKNILIKVTISLLAGAATAIGMRAGTKLCDSYENKKYKQTTGHIHIVK